MPSDALRRMTLSFLYKMTDSEVTINATRVGLEVMSNRKMEKCVQYLPDGKPTNHPTTQPTEKPQQIESWDLLGNYLSFFLKIKRKLRKQN